MKAQPERFELHPLCSGHYVQAEIAPDLDHENGDP